MLSHSWLFLAPWTVDSMGFSQQEYWSGVPFSPPGDLPKSGIEPESLRSLAFAGRFFISSATWETKRKCLWSYLLRLSIWLFIDPSLSRYGFCFFFTSVSLCLVLCPESLILWPMRIFPLTSITWKVPITSQSNRLGFWRGIVSWSEAWVISWEDLLNLQSQLPLTDLTDANKSIRLIRRKIRDWERERERERERVDLGWLWPAMSFHKDRN